MGQSMSNPSLNLHRIREDSGAAGAKAIHTFLF